MPANTLVVEISGTDQSPALEVEISDGAEVSEAPFPTPEEIRLRELEALPALECTAAEFTPKELAYKLGFELSDEPGESALDEGMVSALATLPAQVVETLLRCVAVLRVEMNAEAQE